MKNYRPLKENQKAYLKNFYLYENDKDNKLAALFIVSKINGKIYFVDFKDLSLDDPVFDNELEIGAQIWNDTFVQKFWVKQLAEFLLGLVEVEKSTQKVIKSKKLNLIKIDSLDDIFKYDNEKEVNVFEIAEDKFKNVGHVTEMLDDAMLGMTSELLASDKVYKVLDKDLLKDLENSYNWMLDSIYDN